MTEQTETTAVSEVNGGQAAASSSSQAVNNVNVRVVVQAPRQSGGGGGGTRRAPRPAPRQQAPRESQTQPAANPATPARASQPNRVNRHDEFDADGDHVITLTDNQGGRVRIHYDDGTVRTSFSDRTEILTTQDDQGGFRNVIEENYREAGEPRSRAIINKATEGSDSIYGFRGSVQCRAGTSDRSSVAATGAVIDSVTRNEIQDFLNRHPAIRETMRQMNATITELNDRPATTSDVLSQPGNFRACPENRTDLTVQRLR